MDGKRKRIILLGAAGRDFHNFNTLYRSDPSAQIVAFTAQQIPHIAGRRYPPDLAGDLYPDGIPILDESLLEELIVDYHVDECVMSYSDVSHEDVMHLASRANAVGADFLLLGACRTMLRASVPVIAVCAARTGAGKSQTSRAVVRLLRDRAARVAVIRHPMPYGDLSAERVQRFETREDLARHHVTIEEREEYEPHLEMGSVVLAGVDYEAILREAERNADVIVWDGGNNDTPFFEPTTLVTVVDPHRAGHEAKYFPGETNVRMADWILINKVDTAPPGSVETLEASVRALNPGVPILHAASPIRLEHEERIAGRRVIAIEDGPTVTHGGMPFGAAWIAARRASAEIVDPRPFATGEIAETYRRYPALGTVLPAMGYGDEQVRDLHETLERAAEGGVEAVVVGTPIDLAKLFEIPMPHARARYGLEVRGTPTLDNVIAAAVHRLAVPV